MRVHVISASLFDISRSQQALSYPYKPLLAILSPIAEQCSKIEGSFTSMHVPDEDTDLKVKPLRHVPSGG